MMINVYNQIRDLFRVQKYIYIYTLYIYTLYIFILALSELFERSEPCAQKSVLSTVCQSSGWSTPG